MFFFLFLLWNLKGIDITKECYSYRANKTFESNKEYQQFIQLDFSYSLYESDSLDKWKNQPECPLGVK